MTKLDSIKKIVKSLVTPFSSRNTDSNAVEFQTTLRVIRKSPLSLAGATMIASLVTIALFAPYLAPYSPVQLYTAAPLSPPTFAHLFGTDSVGRDIISRILFGIGISLEVGVLVIASGVIIGLFYGSVAGYLGGKVDEIMMRITDVFLSVPSLLLAIAVAAALGPSLEHSMVAMAVVWWPGYARLVRGSVLSVKENLYIEAARAVGESRTQTILRHIIPNVISPVLVIATFDFGFAINTEAGLSFIGVGAQPPTPELGAMVAVGRNYILTHWWIATLPGLVVFLVVLAFNLFGDGLKDALDPKLRHG